MELKRIGFGLGSISFHPKVDEVPASSARQGNVTINNAARPGTPAHFIVSNHIACDFEHEGVEQHEYINWGVVVTGFDGHARYGEVENAAARKLAPMLRALADEIEETLKENDSQPEPGE